MVALRFSARVHLACQMLIALVNVNRLPKGSATDMSLLPQGISSIPGLIDNKSDSLSLLTARLLAD